MIHADQKADAADQEIGAGDTRIRKVVRSTGLAFRSLDLVFKVFRSSGLLSTGLLFTGCHSVPPPTPLSQLSPQQVQGYNVFQSHCALCHYERTNQPKNGPALVGLYKKPYLPSGAPANDDRVTATVLHGRNLMPPQINVDPESLAQLLAYLHTV